MFQTKQTHRRIARHLTQDKTKHLQKVPTKNIFEQIRTKIAFCRIVANIWINTHKLWVSKSHVLSIFLSKIQLNVFGN